MKPLSQRNCLYLAALLSTACAVGLVLTVRWLTKTDFLDSSPQTIADANGAVSADPVASPIGQARLKASTTFASEHSEPPSEGTFERALQETLERLRTERAPGQNRILLDALKQQSLNADSKEEAAAAIVGILRSGEDATTGLAFRVGPDHAMVESPTFRTALLDWLGQLDPIAAADHARQIFEAMPSPEEYALALRNFARGRPDQRDELRNYFGRLLTHAPWANQPTAGYLESLDVVPHLGDPTFINPLSRFLAPSARTSVRHASLVALDRLVLANPAGVFAELLDAAALGDQPLVRASFLARADVRDPHQCKLVERYLMAPWVSDLELDKFVSLFPNGNRFVSYNLLTDSGGTSLQNLASMDEAALKQVRSWQREPRFSRLEPRLKKLESRMAEQVESAMRNGYFARKN